MTVTASGLNSTITSYTSQTTISSSAANSNNQALNGALDPTFSTLGVAGATEIDGNLTIGSPGALIFSGPGYTSIHSNGFGAQVITHTLSASGTITHQLGYTPYCIYTECSTTGSNTAGHDSVGSTTYHVTLGASQSNISYAG